MRTKRTVARESWGFIHFPTAFKACAARLDSSMDWDPVISSLVLEAPSDAGGQHVELLLDFSPQDLARQAQLRVEDLRVAVLYGNRQARRYLPLFSISVEECPRSWSGRIPVEYLNPARGELSLYMHLGGSLQKALGRPWRSGSVLAVRSWTISDPKRPSLFTVNWTSFSEKGWPEQAVWRLELETSVEFDSVSPEDAVTVHVNKDLVALRRLLQANAKRSGKLAPTALTITPMIIAAVTDELLRRVLGSVEDAMESGMLDVDELDPETLLGRVFKAAEKLGLDAPTAVHLAAHEHSDLTARIQDYFAVGKALDQTALDRMLAR